MARPQRHGASGSPSSLRSRLLFLICLATLPALLFAVYAADREREAAWRRTEREALHQARVMAREHLHQIQGARSLLSWLAERLAREGPGSPLLREPEFLAALLAGHPQLANVGVLSPQGEVLVSAYPSPHASTWRDHPAFRAALDSPGPVAGTYSVSPIFGRPTLNHALAVRGAAGEVTEVLFSGLDLAWLSDLARNDPSLGAPTLMLLDRHGRVLAAGGDEIPTGTSLGVDDATALSRGGGGIVRRLGSPPQERLVVAAPLQDLEGVFVAVALRHEAVVGWSRDAFLRTLLGLGLITLFTIGAAFVAAEVGVLRALRALADTVRRLGRGDYSVRADAPEGYGELGALARAFNAMADDLQRRHGEARRAQARLRALARRAQTAREEEAARISRELHDEIGQLLTSLKIDLARLPARCGPGDVGCAEALGKDCEELGARIVAALDFVRRISSELRPPVLDRLGLCEALRWLGREVEARGGLEVRVRARDPKPAPAPDVAVALFRIAQEALTNVVRHARARRVAVRLEMRGDVLHLRIADDGCGLPPGIQAASHALGLAGMRERAALVGGRLRLGPARGRGTLVRVAVPHPPVARHANPPR